VHGAEVGEVDGEESAQMHRYSWHGLAQVSMKVALKKWGMAAEQAITIKMKQLHWCNLYKPMHWHELTQPQKEHILKSHIFVEEKQDGKIKARKVVRGNKQ
jgi:hypothetical protein